MAKSAQLNFESAEYKAILDKLNTQDEAFVVRLENKLIVIPPVIARRYPKGLIALWELEQGGDSMNMQLWDEFIGLMCDEGIFTR